MNILFLDQFSELGGAQQCLLELMPAIRERGWHAHAAVPAGGPLFERLHAEGVAVSEIRCGPYHSGWKSAGDIARFAWDLPSQISTIRRLLNQTDLVYVNGPRLLPAAALATRKRVPVLLHAHIPLEQGYSARMAGWSLQSTRSAAAACCDFAAGPLRTYLPSERLRVIQNGTVDMGFRDRAFDRWRIGLIGRIAPEKGQADFLRAAARLPGAQFVICGEPLFGETERLESRGLPVEFLGWRNDIAAVLAGLDLLVMPSRREGMPRVLLEAFSAGVPVVAYPAGGIPEVIQDGVTGFLVPEATPDALAIRLLELMEGDPERLRRVSRNARRAWEQSHTLDAWRNAVTTLMEDLQTGRLVPGAAQAKSAPPAALETEAPRTRKPALRP